LFPVKIGTMAKGTLACNSEALSRPPTVTIDREVLEHGWYGQLRVQQWFSTEEAVWLQGLRQASDRIALSFLAFEVPVRVEGISDLAPGSLQLNGGQEVVLR